MDVLGHDRKQLEPSATCYKSPECSVPSMIRRVLFILAVVVALFAAFISFTRNPSATTFQPLRNRAMSVSRSVVNKVLSMEQEEGAGALVRRSIGSMKQRNLRYV